MIGDKAEGIPCRSCHREEDYIRRPQESLQPRERDAPAEVKKAYDSARMEDITQKFPNTKCVSVPVHAIRLHDFALLAA